ncbi:MAG: hypothetical protein WKH97_04970 [Casimicrobiaceae bacterium]
MSLRDDFVVARRATPLLGRIKYRSNIVSQDESQFLLQIRAASSAFGQLQSSRRSAQFRRKRSKQAGQREIDPQAQPAPDYAFDQRIAW